MPRTLADLVRSLELTQGAPDQFIGVNIDSILQRTFGGQVLAQAVVAASRTVPDNRVIHSLHAYFLREGRLDAPITYDVERVRDGGSFSSRRIYARQHGKTIFMMSCSFHILEQGLEHADPMPEVDPPEDCPPVAELLRGRFGKVAADFWGDWQDLEVRYAGDPAHPNGVQNGHPASLRVWVRTAGDLPTFPMVHQAVMAYLSDLTILSVTTIPHPIEWTAPDLVAASLDHAMWFHRPFEADRWLLYDQVSPSASAGLGLATGNLFQDGRLVASCAQQGLIRVGGRRQDPRPA